MKNFQSFWLDQIKQKSNASFVGYETEKGVTRLKLVIGGEAKYISLTGGFENVTIETYAELIKQITE
jgi:hypothetical protein